MGSPNRPRGRRDRRWFLRPLWRDPAFLLATVLGVGAGAAIIAAWFPKADTLAEKVLIVLYTLAQWLIICTLVAIPVRTIRMFWRGRDESDAAAARGDSKAEQIGRASGRYVGRIIANARGRRPGAS